MKFILALTLALCALYAHAAEESESVADQARAQLREALSEAEEKYGPAIQEAAGQLDDFLANLVKEAGPIFDKLQASIQSVTTNVEDALSKAKPLIAEYVSHKESEEAKNQPARDKFEQVLQAALTKLEGYAQQLEADAEPVLAEAKKSEQALSEAVQDAFAPVIAKFESEFQSLFEAANEKAGPAIEEALKELSAEEAEIQPSIESAQKAIQPYIEEIEKTAQPAIDALEQRLAPVLKQLSALIEHIESL